MKKIVDDPQSPLKYVADDGRTIGQFYNSYDRTHHLAEYIPYRQPPDRYLCGGRGNFSPSKDERPDLNRCARCFEELLLVEKPSPDQECGDNGRVSPGPASGARSKR